MLITHRLYRVLYLLLGWALLSCGKNEPQEPVNTSGQVQRYPYRSAHIVYTYSDASIGTEETFIADYGNFEATYSDANVFNEVGVRPNKGVSIQRGPDLFQFERTVPQGRYIRIPFLDSIYQLKGNYPHYSVLVNKMLEDGMFQYEGTDIVCGLPAQKWQQVMGRMTLWIYNGLILKRAAMGERGIAVTTAVSVDTMKFVIPDSIHFQSLPPPVRGR